MKYLKCIKCDRKYSEKSYVKAMILEKAPAICWTCRTMPKAIIDKEVPKERPCLSCGKTMLTIAKVRMCRTCKKRDIYVGNSVY